ncbi:MAG TPA: DUF448 domain-containing protein [Desulfonatronum sp.]|nr:DUF448 domain-containing protein [Desulfonatronum sp.]
MEVQAGKQGTSLHAPVRMCIFCRGRFPKSHLRRFVCDPVLGQTADPLQRLPGRGFYVCEHSACLDKITSMGKCRKRRKGEIHGQ